jgi:hypothetical protein
MYGKICFYLLFADTKMHSINWIYFSRFGIFPAGLDGPGRGKKGQGHVWNSPFPNTWI